MGIEIHHDESADAIIVRDEGVANAEVFLRWVRAMLESGSYRPGMNILFDFSALTASEIGRDDMHRLVDALAREFEPGRTGRVALVAIDRLGFGLSRMFNVFAESAFDREYGVFRDRAEALAWLASGTPDVASEAVPLEGAASNAPASP